MKTFKFILTTILVLFISFGIPFLVFYLGIGNRHYSTAESSEFSGPIGYYEQIMNDENSTETIKQKTVNFFNEYISIIKGEYHDFYNFFLTAGFVISLFVIVLGFSLNKALENKIYSYATILSGILSLIAYLIVYFSIYTT